MAEKEQENENSQGWLPEMSFQTVLSIVGIVFTAIELYQRFRLKDSSAGGEAAVQSPIFSITAEPRAEPRAEPKHSGAPSRALSERSPGRRSEQSSERSADRRLSPKFGMV